MKDWMKIVDANLIPINEGRKVSVNGVEVGIFNLGDRFLAVKNSCPHQKGPLSDGIVSGGSVFCPLHNWKISLQSGRVENPADQIDCSVKTYHLEKKGDDLFIQL